VKPGPEGSGAGKGRSLLEDPLPYLLEKVLGMVLVFAEGSRDGENQGALPPDELLKNRRVALPKLPEVKH